jgi:hypothetical protein
MSRENIDVIHRSIAAFNSGDLEEMIGLADPGWEWLPGFGAATDRRTAYHGHDVAAGAAADRSAEEAG